MKIANVYSFHSKYFSLLLLIALFIYPNFSSLLSVENADTNLVNIRSKVIAYDENRTPASLFSSRIVYIGESHTNYAHHLKQLQLIKTLHGRHKEIAVAMEMFSSESQKTLDSYIKSEISEIEMLKQTNYFLEWGYDYRYYRDILRYCRKESIHIIALNLKQDIIRKLGRYSFSRLPKKEIDRLPKNIDFSNSKYIVMLKESFLSHPGFSSRHFTNFYLAQITRDEYMAETIVNYANKYPKRKLIVLTGSGHIEYGHGIPKRVLRRIKVNHTSILLDAPFDPDAADLFMHTKNIEFKASPLLGIIIKPQKTGSGGPVIVEGFSSEEVQKNHVLKKGDKIVSIDNAKIESIEDLKIILYLKNYGDEITIKIRRKEKLITKSYTLTAPKRNHHK